jgi:hypothetical protein
MQVTMRIGNTIRFIAIAGVVSALCFTEFAASSDDTAKESQHRAASLEDLLGSVVEESTATLLSSLHVGEGVEKSLWETILSPKSLTCEESTHFDGSVELVRGVLLVQLIVPSESIVREKRESVPFAEGAHIRVSYNILKRNVDRPIASIYYVDARRAREPRVRLAAFFVFDTEKRTWSRVPSSPLR